MSAVPIAEVLVHLNMKDDSDSAIEVSGMLDAAEKILSHSVGPLEPQPATTARVQGSDSIVLPTVPVSEVTTVTRVQDGATVVTSTDDLDSLSGVLRLPSGWPGAEYDVTYVAGWDELPADLVLAVKELVRHLWRSQRGPAVRRPGSDPDAQTPGYLLPYLVEQLIEPYRMLGVGAA